MPFGSAPSDVIAEVILHALQAHPIFGVGSDSLAPVPAASSTPESISQRGNASPRTPMSTAKANAASAGQSSPSVAMLSATAPASGRPSRLTARREEASAASHEQVSTPTTSSNLLSQWLDSIGLRQGNPNAAFVHAPDTTASFKAVTRRAGAPLPHCKVGMWTENSSKCPGL